MASADDNGRAVRAAFLPWEQGDSGPFFDLVADDVRWTVIGSTPVSGVYDSKQALISGAFGPLLKRLNGRLVTRLVDISAVGDKVFLQHESSGVTTDGIPYEQVYCFAMRMRDLRIVEIVAYLDTELLSRVLAEPTAGGDRAGPSRVLPTSHEPKPHEESRAPVAGLSSSQPDDELG